jgi:hypothetical protein
MIVMGLDQRRGQITAEWIETETGEVSRSRVSPAHREPVRRFLGRTAAGAHPTTTGRIRDPQPRQPGRRACRGVPTQIRRSPWHQEHFARVSARS